MTRVFRSRILAKVAAFSVWCVSPNMDASNGDGDELVVVTGAPWLLLSYRDFAGVVVVMDRPPIMSLRFCRNRANLASGDGIV